MQVIRTALIASTLLAVTQSGCVAEQQSARWYRGNTHTHSLWSDGDDFPEMIVDWYRRNGYDFLALSDHNILSKGEKWIDVAYAVRHSGAEDVLEKYKARFPDNWVETREHDGRQQVRLKTLEEFRPLFEKPGEFLLIQAEEITDNFERKPVHINALNLEEVIKPQRGSSVRDTIRNNLRAVKEQEERLGRPILAHLNHPNFGWGITAEDIAYILEDDFFEVYNGHGSINHEGDAYRPGDEAIWDIANTIRLGELKARPLYCVATDDSHNYHAKTHAITGRGWIWVRSEKLDADSLILAMRRGDFYASSGVKLRDVRFDANSGTLTIEIDPVPGETYTTHFIGTEIDYDRTTQPARDKDGNEVPDRRQYSADVGKTFATVEGTKATYKLTGRELYVRATIVSSAAPERPVYRNQKKKAWTQPVGWEKYVKTE